MHNIAQSSTSTHQPSSAVQAFEDLLTDPSLQEPDEHTSDPEWTPRDFIAKSNTAFSKHYNIQQSTLAMLHEVQTEHESKILNSLIDPIAIQLSWNGETLLRLLANQPGHWIPIKSLFESLDTNARGFVAIFSVANERINGTSLRLERQIRAQLSDTLVRLTRLSE